MTAFGFVAGALLLGTAAAPADFDAIEAAIDAGRLTQARMMLASADLAKATGERVDMVLGRYFLAQGQDVLALERFDRLLVLGPSSRAATGAGMASLRLNQPDKAKRYFTSAIAEDPNSWQAWNGLGVIADAARDWSGAEAAYDRALALRPQEAAILNNKGYSLTLQHRYAEAAAVLEKAAKQEPGNPRIRTNLQMALALGGNYPAAIGADGGDARRLNNAGYAAWMKGDLSAARALLARAVEASPSWYEVAAANLETVEGEWSK
jgi:Flp pilus assembly protein TadD